MGERVAIRPEAEAPTDPRPEPLGYGKDGRGADFWRNVDAWFRERFEGFVELVRSAGARRFGVAVGSGLLAGGVGLALGRMACLGAPLMMCGGFVLGYYLSGPKDQT